MIIKAIEPEHKIYAPKPIRHSIIPRTCMTSFQSKILPFVLKERQFKPPKKKMASALEFASFAEIERDFSIMRRSHEDPESTEELISILSNTNNNENNDSSQSDLSDNDNIGITLNMVERSSNPFSKNFPTND